MSPKPDLLDRKDVRHAIMDDLYRLPGSTLAALARRELVRPTWSGRGRERRRDWEFAPAGEALRDRLLAEREAATAALDARCKAARERLAEWGIAVAYIPWNSTIPRVKLDMDAAQAEALLAAVAEARR